MKVRVLSSAPSLESDSYIAVDGQKGRESLAGAVSDTLFFAGEATDSEEGGTVTGALRSGARAAREVHESLDGSN